MQYKLEDFYFNQSDMIGQGASGEVYKCKLLSDNNKEFVIKIVRKKINDQELEILRKIMLSTTANENVVQVYVIENKSNSLYIVMEYCQTDLQKVMQQRNKPFSQEEALYIIQQIANGYKICLQNQIIHRDIKPANILVKDNKIYKLADFGEGKIFENNIKSFSNQTLVGTPAYCSPQITLSEEDKAKATNKIDVYSLGMIFLQLLSGKLPFSPQCEQSLLNFLHQLRTNTFYLQGYIPNLRSDIADLLMSMLQFEEKQRIGWHEFLNHKLVKNPIQSPIKKSIITVKSIVAYNEQETQQLLELFELKKNELIFLNDFQKMPTNEGFESLRSYLIQNKQNLMKQLPYNQDKKYSLEYIRIIFIFQKIIRNDQIVFSQLHDINILKDYLKN